MAEHFDVVIVGAGVQGSFAAYHLAKKGKRCLLLDQFPLPHTRGSSHGGTRIIRKAYPEEGFSKMMEECYQIWKKVERESGETLYRETALLYLSTSESANQIVSDVRSAMHTNGFDCADVSHSDLKKKYPLYDFPASSLIVKDGSAGSLYASKAVTAVQSLFVRAGGTIRDVEEVKDIIPGYPVKITTNRRKYTTDRVVLCGGAWNHKLCRMVGLDLPMRAVRAVYGYYKVNEGFSYESYPSFIMVGDVGNYYGLPAHEYPGMMKVSPHSSGYKGFIDPDRRDADVETDLAILNRTSRFVRDYFPGLDSKPAIVEKCMYTATPDGKWFLGKHPQWNNIAVAGGFCGAGFKMGPVVGKLLGELTCDQKPSYDLTEHSITRKPVHSNL